MGLGLGEDRWAPRPLATGQAGAGMVVSPVNPELSTCPPPQLLTIIILLLIIIFNGNKFESSRHHVHGNRIPRHPSNFLKTGVCCGVWLNFWESLAEGIRLGGHWRVP